MLATAGQWVNTARQAMAGRSRSQPWIVAARRLFMGRTAPDRPGAFAPAGAASSIGPEDALGLGLRVVQRGSRLLRARQGRLQAVVEGLGDTLILVGRELRHRELQLVARNRGRREVGDVFLHVGRLI